MREKDDAVQAIVDAVDDYTELYPGVESTPTQLIIGWGRKGVGWGMLSFFEKDGVFECDNECMGRQFCKVVLERLTEGMSYADLPPLMQRFQTIDALLDACKPTSPRGDWK